MNKSESFVFQSYNFEVDTQTLFLHYRVDFLDERDPLRLEERIVFPSIRNLDNIPKTALEKSFQFLHLIAGISYYKLYISPEIIIEDFEIPEDMKGFLDTLYVNGLGEYLYLNQLSPHRVAKFPRKKDAWSQEPRYLLGKKVLVGIGGGKDSIVVAERFKKNQLDFDALVVETQKPSPIIDAVCETGDYTKTVVKRYLDPVLFDPPPDTLNGHVPISAIIAAIGVCAGLLGGYKGFVVGNEESSNDFNLEYCGVEVNHQWSKSFVFEEAFSDLIHKYVAPLFDYYSALRHLKELRIAKMFTRYDKFHQVFSSSNLNFKVHKDRPMQLWNKEDPKSQFVFLILAPFMTKEKLISIFGEYYFDHKELLDGFCELIGVKGIKPFECVASAEECRAACVLAKEAHGDSPVLASLLAKFEMGENMALKFLSTKKQHQMPDYVLPAVVDSLGIVGYGVEGKCTRKYISQKYPEVEISIHDKLLNEDYLKASYKHDLIIKTPGLLASKVPGLHTTATNIFFSKAKNETTNIVGVTGTKGKSTTSTIIAAALRSTCSDVRAGGNIGVPVLSLLETPSSRHTIYVLELSSYQLDDIRYSPAVAVITNLYTDHLDYHKNSKNYHGAKRNIYKFQSHNDKLLVSEQTRISGRASVYSHANMPCEHTGKLIGEHNIENIKAAWEVSREFGVSPRDFCSALSLYEPLPHRLEHIGNFNGIQFYDDAISTTPESTIAALTALPETQTLLLGGTDRGYDFEELVQKISNSEVKNIVLFPDSGLRIKALLGDLYNVLVTKNMEEAVSFAFAHTTRDKIVLLSTASPSYSLWKNFEEKGCAFQNNVTRYGQGKEIETT